MKIIEVNTCFIRDEDFRHILLQQRLFTNKNAPGMWETPGGKRDPEDPSLEASAVREIEEELGVRFNIEAKVVTCYDLPSSNPQFDRYEITGFLGTIQGTPVPREAEQLKWCSIDELHSLPNYKEFVTSFPPLLAALYTYRRVHHKIGVK